MKTASSGSEPNRESNPSTFSGSLDPSSTASKVALKALQERPKISIRMQIYISLIFFLVVIVFIVAALGVATHYVEKKIEFLEVAYNYLFHIQQARRYEKNFFLYNTGLAEAVDSVRQAEEILERDAEPFRSVVGADVFDEILSQLREYGELLRELEGASAESGSAAFENQKRSAEPRVREHGHETVLLARDVVQKEKRAVDRVIVLSRNIHFGSLLLLSVAIGFNTHLLARRLLKPINRFVNYAQRIATGDYTRIMPAKPYRDEFSHLAMAINQMIDELEKRQDILVQSHKLRAVGTLTAGVAHELNNPLNNLMLTGHMLLEDYHNLSDEDRLDMIQDVANETARCKKIIANLLDFARESESAMVMLNLGEVLDETVTLAANQINLAGIEVKLDIQPGLPPICGDKQQLTQVFLNLVLNAVDVTQKGGRLDISARRSDETGFVDVLVKDYGPGIPEHILSSIFDPFFTTKAKRGGTGLGLSVSQGIVGKHGGEIRVDSKPGRGTVFVVTLPVASFGIGA